MKKISIAFLTAPVVLGGTSCLKDKEFDEYRYGINHPEDSPVGVGFAQALNKINVTSINNVNTSQTIEIGLVNLLSDEPASKDIHVTLVYDPTLITRYNTMDENNDGVPDNVPILPLPPSAFTTNGLVVTIPAGQRTGVLSLTIPSASTSLDLTKTYALGLRIASVQETDINIASNLRTMLVGIAIKNQYDGIYDYKGYALRAGDPALTGNFTGAEMTLITAGANSVDFGSLALWGNKTGIGIGNPRLDVNPTTNKVTISSSGGATNLPGYDSRYDPATRTFYIGFTWGAGPAARAAIDTLTYNRPR